MPDALRAACLALAALLLAAQSNEKRVSPVASDQAAHFNRANTVGVAILVGVGKYPPTAA
jgi:hypothetical protein